MSCPIDPREVNYYLHELGYRNISTQQLKEFIKDLRKLIKYDERKQQEQGNKENVHPECKDKMDVFESLYENKTLAAKAKLVPPKKDKVITVQIKQHKATCRHRQKAETKKNEMVSETKSSQVSSTSVATEETQTSKESDKVVVKVPISAQSKKSAQETQGFELKPKASFIRPKSSNKPTRSDPVSLYHRYQAEWKKQKIPGEENYSNLRWVIREKMLGDQQSTASAEATKKKSSKNARN